MKWYILCPNFWLKAFVFLISSCHLNWISGFFEYIYKILMKKSIINSVWTSDVDCRSCLIFRYTFQGILFNSINDIPRQHIPLFRCVRNTPVIPNNKLKKNKMNHECENSILLLYKIFSLSKISRPFLFDIVLIHLHMSTARLWFLLRYERKIIHSKNLNT